MPQQRRPAPSRRPPAPPRPRRVLRLGDHRKRLRIAVVVMGVVLSLFMGRLVQLQGLDGSAYAVAATGKRTTTVTLPALRGTISDVHGVGLATTVDAIDITADQTLFATSTSSPARVAAAIAPMLGMDVADVTAKLTGADRFVYVKKQVPPETWAAIKELPSVDRVSLVPQDVGKRVYPSGTLAANVVGFVGADGDGLGGLEYADRDLLAGKDGRATYERSPGGQQLPHGPSVTTPPVAGQDLTLTLDSDIQWEAQRALEAQVKLADAESGDAVVMDVRTGRILAMATAPTFDANLAAKADAKNRINRPLADVFEPGSTSKVMTMSALIDSGMKTAMSPVTVPNRILKGGKYFHDDVSHPTWHLTLAGVLAKSSNIGTILASEDMPDATLYHYLKKFGLGAGTSLGFPGESRGILARWQDWSHSQRFTIRFGQGLSLTTVQAASVYATIANDGVRVEPSLVDHWTTADGVVHRNPAPARVRVISPAAARTVRTMMEAVVSDKGTAPMAQIPGYRVAGKTGTANRAVNGRYQGYTASFLGMAPADKPRFVVAVVLQDPKNGHFGGRLAGPVFKDVMSFTLKSQGVPPTGSASPTMTLSTD